jgi:uncharacterized protein (TIGR02996 family)
MSQRKSLPLVSQQEDPFILAILDAPEDEAPRLIYADWLEERGDARGEYLRLDCQLAALPQDDPCFDGLVVRFRELHFQVDPRWRTAVSRSRIEKCPQFEFRCPRRWDNLQLTGNARVRFCTACRAEVHYADDLRQAREHAEMGRCVAVDPAVPRWEGDLDPEEFMGIIDIDNFPDPEPRYAEPPRPPRRKPRPWWRIWD